jgi:hypothetical protein
MQYAMQVAVRKEDAAIFKNWQCAHVESRCDVYDQYQSRIRFTRDPRVERENGEGKTQQ